MVSVKMSGSSNVQKIDKRLIALYKSVKYKSLDPNELSVILFLL